VVVFSFSNFNGGVGVARSREFEFRLHATNADLRATPWAYCIGLLVRIDHSPPNVAFAENEKTQRPTLRPRLLEANGLCCLRMDDCDGTICSAGSFAATVPAAGAGQMPQVIEQFAADRMSLSRMYPLTRRSALKRWSGGCTVRRG
jgi:hypothetical protein